MSVQVTLTPRSSDNILRLSSLPFKLLDVSHQEGKCLYELTYFVNSQERNSFDFIDLEITLVQRAQGLTSLQQSPVSSTRFLSGLLGETPRTTTASIFSTRLTPVVGVAQFLPTPSLQINNIVNTNSRNDQQRGQRPLTETLVPQSSTILTTTQPLLLNQQDNGEWKVYKTTFWFPVQAVDLNCNLTPKKLDNSVAFNKVGYTIRHQRDLRVFSTPKLAPKVEAVYPAKANKVTLRIAQIDPTATFVRLYRQKYGMPYEFLAQLPLTKDQVNGIVFNDLVANNRRTPIFYTAIAVGEDDHTSATYSVSATQYTYTNGFFQEHNPVKPVVKAQQVNPNEVVLSCTSIPPSTVSISFLRKPKGNVTPERIGTSRELFKDSSVRDGNYYEYLVECVTKTGKRIPGANVFPIQVKNVSSSGIGIRLTNLQTLTTDDGNVNVLFDIQTSTTQTFEQQIKTALENQGILSFFETAITENRLQDLICHKVTRIKESTGEVVDLGLLPTNLNSFDDLSLSTRVNAPSLEPDQQYTYVVESYLRSPATMLENYERSVTNSLNTNFSYTYSPAKWLNERTKKTGTILVSSPVNNFLDGTLVSREQITVLAPSVSVAISNQNTYQLDSDLVQVSWSVAFGRGENSVSETLSHFLVNLKTRNSRTNVVSTLETNFVHPFSDTGNFVFYDKVNTLGKRSFIGSPTEKVFYEIIPVSIKDGILTTKAVETSSISLINPNRLN